MSGKHFLISEENVFFPLNLFFHEANTSHSSWRLRDLDIQKSSLRIIPFLCPIRDCAAKDFKDPLRDHTFQSILKAD